MSSDPYVYPGTTVLKNIPGIRSQEILDLSLPKMLSVANAFKISDHECNPC